MSNEEIIDKLMQTLPPETIRVIRDGLSANYYDDLDGETGWVMWQIATLSPVDFPPETRFAILKSTSYKELTTLLRHALRRRLGEDQQSK